MRNVGHRAISIHWLMVPLLWGVVHGWSMGTPWDGQALWWLQIMALMGLLHRVLQAPSVAWAVMAGWVFGIGWFTSSMWWLFTSMHTYGGLAAPLAALAVLALCSLLGIFYGIACGIFVRLRARNSFAPGLMGALLMTALWLLAELTRGSLWSGLPWSAIGYAHIDSPFARLAPYMGVYGMAAAAVFVCMTLLTSRSCGLKIAMLLALLLSSCYKSAPADAPVKASTSAASLAAPVRVTLLQGNIPQNEKFDMHTGVESALNWYKQELLKIHAGMVIAPETAIPLLPQQLPMGYWPELHAHFQATESTSSGSVSNGQRAALVGIPLGSTEEGYTNSVLGLGSPEVYRYDKHHLVPFGEFIPPLFKWFTRMMNIPLGDFNRGEVGQTSFTHAGQRWAPLICYEDLFGEELAVRFTKPDLAPTILVNSSNIGWFGNGIAIDQHLNISRLRAIEFDRPVVRATNTGATAIIDRHGQVTHSLPRTTRGILVGDVQGSQNITFYATWVSQYGLWPLWLLSLLTVAYASACASKGSRSKK